jgi:hypothetical protein
MTVTVVKTRRADHADRIRFPARPTVSVKKVFFSITLQQGSRFQVLRLSLYSLINITVAGDVRQPVEFTQRAVPAA